MASSSLVGKVIHFLKCITNRFLSTIEDGFLIHYGWSFHSFSLKWSFVTCWSDTYHCNIKDARWCARCIFPTTCESSWDLWAYTLHFNFFSVIFFICKLNMFVRFPTYRNSERFDSLFLTACPVYQRKALRFGINVMDTEKNLSGNVRIS